jgi:hypothetical protein
LPDAKFVYSKKRLAIPSLTIIDLQRLISDQRERYKKEQHLMLGVVHKYGMNTARDLLGSHLQQQARGGPSSWLGQQRNKVRFFP